MSLPSTAPLSVFVSLNSPAPPRKLTERFRPAIVASERFLIDNKFMSGASFSMADIAAFALNGFDVPVPEVDARRSSGQARLPNRLLDCV